VASLKQVMYWKAPYFVKNWLASVNARKLDRERYGPEYQRQQLQALMKLAATRVPYYRKMFSEKRIDPRSIESPEHLQQLPILEKEIVRASPTSLIDETLDKRRLLCGHTSGTTGTPLTLYRDVWLSSAQFAYLDARWHKVVGMSRRANPSVCIGGHLVAAPNQTRPPFWVYNRRWKQLYMSSYHLSPKYLGYYVDELRKFRTDYIEGYPSSIYSIARYILDKKLAPVPFKACFTTAETLFDYHREAIKEACGCRTYDQYGCGEMVVFAAECEGGSMHLSPEYGVVEVVDENDKPVAVGQTGQLICTSLVNWVQPFIRYRLGDIGVLRSGQCSCGSSLPMLDSIGGRVDEVLITRDGRRIGRLDPVFKGLRGFYETQVVQDDYDRFRIRIVPSSDYTEEDGQIAISNFAQRVGKADIRIELVKAIERTSAGKFRAVVCNLAEASRQFGKSRP
jgi:phenylacetate-CoA ligase